MTLLGSETVTVTPQTQTTTAGVIGLVAGTPFTAVGTVVPSSPRQTEQLSEAARVRARWIMYVEGTAPAIKITDMSASPRTPGDRITRANGKVYVALGEIDFTIHATGLPHKTYLLAEVAGDE